MLYNYMNFRSEILISSIKKLINKPKLINISYQIISKNFLFFLNFTISI